MGNNSRVVFLLGFSWTNTYHVLCELSVPVHSEIGHLLYRLFLDWLQKVKEKRRRSYPKQKIDFTVIQTNMSVFQSALVFFAFFLWMLLSWRSCTSSPSIYSAEALSPCFFSLQCLQPPFVNVSCG